MQSLCVYWVDLSSADDAFCSRLLTQATPERQQRAMASLRPDARLRGLAAGALLHYAMDQAAIPLEERRIRTTAQRKPMLDAPLSASFQFNLSHSGNLALCAVDAAPLGVDVETAAHPSLRIADRQFTPGETAWLRAQPDPEQAFRRIWVLKESYLKALGCGLTMPLNAFEIRFAPIVHVKRNGLTEPFVFHETVLNQYPAAVCTTNTAPCQWQELPMEALIHI